MWEVKKQIIDKNVHKFCIFEKEHQLSYQDVIQNWYGNPEFRDFYYSILGNSLFEAFFWEHPPITKVGTKQPYEFVLVNSIQLTKIAADTNPFQEQFRSRVNGQNVLAFKNLGRDADLIVPYPIVSNDIYAHFASFIRNAPQSQRHDLFVVLANSLIARMGNEPIWVSTSGLGVCWLHVRLDTRPKYYSYQPYTVYRSGFK